MKKGTLVWLIILLVILGILFALGCPPFVIALEKSRGAGAYRVLMMIETGEKLYLSEYQEYLKWNDTLKVGYDPRLKVSLSQETADQWNFTISTTASIAGQAPTFKATATRRKGPCSGSGNNTITINETGNVTNSWIDCVDTLF